MITVYYQQEMYYRLVIFGLCKYVILLYTRIYSVTSEDQS